MQSLSDRRMNLYHAQPHTELLTSRCYTRRLARFTEVALIQPTQELMHSALFYAASLLGDESAR